MFKRLANLFGSKKDNPDDIAQQKAEATSRGEAFVRVVEVNFDKDNPGQGYFELDWNKPFIKSLLQAGYTGNSEEEIVDAWFTALCRNIANEDI